MAFCLKKDKHHETKTRIYISEEGSGGTGGGKDSCQGNVGCLHRLKNEKEKKEKRKGKMLPMQPALAFMLVSVL